MTFWATDSMNRIASHRPGRPSSQRKRAGGHAPMPILLATLSAIFARGHRSSVEDPKEVMCIFRWLTGSERPDLVSIAIDSDP
jgi:hypothetical protein